MGSTIHGPGKVQGVYITEDALHHKANIPILAPEVNGNYGRNYKAKQHFQQNEIFLMETHDRIGQNVTHVQLTTTFQHLGMFVHHQPAHVSEEKASIRVVRISIGFRILVVNSVIAYPIVQAIL